MTHVMLDRGSNEVWTARDIASIFPSPEFAPGGDGMYSPRPPRLWQRISSHSRAPGTRVEGSGLVRTDLPIRFGPWW